MSRKIIQLIYVLDMSVTNAFRGLFDVYVPS